MNSEKLRMKSKKWNIGDGIWKIENGRAKREI
jgi:hypothetical protein